MIPLPFQAQDSSMFPWALVFLDMHWNTVSVGCFQGDLSERSPTRGWVVFISGWRLHIPLLRPRTSRGRNETVILKLKEKPPIKTKLFGKLTVYQAMINIKCHFLESRLQFSLKGGQTEIQFSQNFKAS